MGRIIAVVNQKGGVGKTTTAVNLGASLARLGQKVLLVDVDPQGNATSGVGVDPQAVAPSLYEVITPGPVGVAAVRRPTAVEGLHLAPASPDLAGANVELINVPRREYRLLEELDAVREEHDFTIIDSPPSLGLLTINGLVAADEVLIPVQCEYYALEGLGQLLKTVSLVKQHLRPELSVLGAVLTMYDGRSKLSEAVFQELYRFFPNRIFRTIIPRSVRLAEAPSHGLDIAAYDPSGRAARAYERLGQEVLAAYRGW